MDTLLKNNINKEMHDNDVKHFVNLIESNQIEAAQLMLEKGMDANSTDHAGNTLLLYAIVTENAKVVELLIKYGANINVKINKGCTLLILVARRNYVTIAELLLKNDAKIEETNDDNMTALMHAAESGHTEMVQLLIRYDAKVRAIGLDGKTALIFSASRGHVEVVKLLILSGANIHELSKVRNKSVIMYAARAGKTKVVDLLIQAGANVKLKDSDGLNALDHAVKNKHISTAYRLLSTYSFEEKNEFAMNNSEKFNLADGFDKELYKYQERIYLILRTPYKLKTDSEKECHFSIFPLEIINFIKILEAKLQNFPDWYQHRIEKDINLVWDFIYTQKKTDLVKHCLPAAAPAVITPLYAIKRRKSTENSSDKMLCEKNKNNEDTEADLNQILHDVSNLKLN